MLANKGELAKAMVDKGFNGGTLAQALGSSPMLVSKMRRGGSVTRRTAMAVCFVLEGKLEELFVLEDEDDETENAANAMRAG